MWIRIFVFFRQCWPFLCIFDNILPTFLPETERKKNMIPMVNDFFLIIFF